MHRTDNYWSLEFAASHLDSLLDDLEVHADKDDLRTILFFIDRYILVRERSEIRNAIFKDFKKFVELLLEEE